MSEEPGEHDLPARPEDYDGIPVGVRLAATADAMEEFNRVLWNIAKSVFIIVAMLLGISMVVIAYYAAEFLATLAVVP